MHMVPTAVSDAISNSIRGQGQIYNIWLCAAACCMPLISAHLRDPTSLPISEILGQSWGIREKLGCGLNGLSSLMLGYCVESCICILLAL